jgi:hypothetical protein
MSRGPEELYGPRGVERQMEMAEAIVKMEKAAAVEKLARTLLPVTLAHELAHGGYKHVCEAVITKAWADAREVAKGGAK